MKHAGVALQHVQDQDLLLKRPDKTFETNI